MVVPVVAVFADGLLDCHILQSCLRIGYTCVRTVNSRMTRIGQVEWPCLAGQRRHAKLSNRRAHLATLFLLRLPPPTLSKHTYICLQSYQLRPRRRRAAAAGLGASSNIINFTTSTSRQVVLGALLGPATLELHIIPNRAQSRLRHVLRELDDVPAGLSVPSPSPPPPSHPTS
jgi:hypothetical protein